MFCPFKNEYLLLKVVESIGPSDKKKSMQRVLKTITTRSRRMCSVSQCSSYSTKDASLNVFPGEKQLCNIWKNILNIGRVPLQHLCQSLLWHQ